MQTKPVLMLDDVKKIAAAAEAEALANNWAVVISIVDDGGHLLWLQRLELFLRIAVRLYIEVFVPILPWWPD